MCKSCKMDPAEVARKQTRQGAVAVDDFDKEVNYRPKKKESKSASRRPGCYANNYKAHVYVWTSEREIKTLFYRYFGFHSRETEVCVGCGKTRGRRHSEKYEKVKRREWNKRYSNEFEVKRGAPVPRREMRRGPSYTWWRWETYDEGYVAYRREYVARHGWGEIVYDY